MTVVNFEELINGGQGMKRAPQGVMNEKIPFVIQDSEALDQAQQLYRKAYVNKQKIKQLLDVAEELCEKAKNQLIELVGHTEYDNDCLTLKQQVRRGSVDWKMFESTYPQIKLHPFRKSSSYFWTIKLKVKE